MATIKYKDSKGNMEELPIMINYNPKTAYDLAVESGFVGTVEEWLKSLAYDDTKLLEKFNSMKQDLELHKTNNTQDIQNYKNTKDLEINTDLEDYKVNATQSIETYKAIKDLEFNKDLETYKFNTTQNIEAYKITKDEEINTNLETYKSNATQNIQDYKLSKDLEIKKEIDKCMSDKNIEINANIESYKNSKNEEINKNLEEYKANTNQSLEAYKNNKNAELNKYVSDKDLEINTIIEEYKSVNVQNVEGNYISVKDTVGGYIDNIEILGNTYQNPTNLADIQSVGTLREDGLYKLSILSCGKNLFDGVFEKGTIGLDGSSVANATAIRSGYIRVKPNTTYMYSSLTTGQSIFFYNSNLVKIGTNVTTNKFTTPSDCSWFRFRLITTDINTKVQIEEGTVATTYEPYQANKSSILLPCQLENVGDIRDRLFRREDGIWCIEKNIKSIILNKDTGWSRQVFSSGVVYFNTPSITDTYMSSSNLLSNRFVGVQMVANYSDPNTYGMYVDANNKIRITGKDIQGFASVNDLYSWIGEIIVKYPTTTPKIIELPLNTQIQLNSYLGTTNVFTEDTIIEPTIRCTIPKSLGASINSLNKKTDIISDRVEKIETLQKGNELEVTTDKGYVVVDNTNEGYVEDLKIEGKTLVNLNQKEINGGIAISTNTFVGSATNRSYIANVEIGKTYTIIKQEITDRFIVGFANIDSFDAPVSIVYNNSSTNVAKVVATNSKLIAYVDNTSTSRKVLILEGDHTQNPPSYFEGLKSVGEDVYNIEVLSCGKNLIDAYSNVAIGMFNDNGIVQENNTFWKYTKDYYKLKPNTSYTINEKSTTNFIQYKIIFYDIKLNIIGFHMVSSSTKQFITPNNTKYCRVCYSVIVSSSPVDREGIQLEEGIVATTYEPYQESKKQILYKTKEGNYEKPILRSTGNVSDTIEKHSDNKYYFHKRCEESILNGSENWVTDNILEINTSRFRCSLFSNMSTTTTLIINNMYYRGVQSHGDYEYVWTNSTNIYISVLKSKLSTQDVNGLKTWLKSNPVTVVYQLATEEIYECTNIDLNSYRDTTFITVESGLINPRFSCKVSKHIGNVVNLIKEKTDNLEEKVEKLIDEKTKGVTTNKGYIAVKDTTNSYIENIKIEGNTLVNLLIDNNRGQNVSLDISNNGTRFIEFDGSMVKLSTLYTFIIYIKSNTTNQALRFPSGTHLFDNKTFVNAGNTGAFMFTAISVNTSPSVNKISLICTEGTGVINFDVMLLEGDHTQNPPSYFEGLKSVGEDVDKVEVLSRKEDGNLFDVNSATRGKALNTDNSGTLTTNANAYVSDFIKCNKNEKYICNRSVATVWTFYDNNKKFISQSVNTQVTSLVEGYLRVHCVYSDVSIENFIVSKNTLVEIPYQESKKQILYKTKEGNYEKPILRSTGNVSDTIEKHSDGKYYFHKRCGEVVLKGAESWIVGGWNGQIDTIGFEISINNSKLSTLCISDKFKGVLQTTDIGLDHEFATLPSVANKLVIKILRTKLATQDASGFKTWLQANPTTVVYQLATEEIYECNYLDINSYEGETLIQIDSGAICPSKISFTTNSDLPNLVNKIKEDVDKNTKFREDVTESIILYKESKYGYIVVDNTKDGYVNDLKVEGNTLVNLLGNQGTNPFSLNPIGDRIKAFKNINFIENKSYTLCINIKTNSNNSTLNLNHLKNSEFANYIKICDAGTTGLIVKLITLSTNYNSILQIYAQAGTTGTIEVENIMLLEGDHTQNPPSYFEGLKSVGDGVDEIEVLSRKEDGNLFDEVDKLKGLYVDGSTSTIKGSANTRSFVFRASKDTDYTITLSKETNRYVFGLTNEYPTLDTPCQIATFKVLTAGKSYSVNSGNYKYVTFYYSNENTDVDIQVVKSQYNDQGNIIHTKNKKQILYQTKEGTYEKPILRSIGSVSDSIEKHSDGKYYYHKRLGEIILNGSESWALAGTQLTNTLTAWKDFEGKRGSNLLTDKFISKVEYNIYDNNSIHSLLTGTNLRLAIRVLKVNLSTTDLAGVKTWLSQNPITVVYELATEEIYECINLDLDSYEGETSVMCNSGAISPQISFKIASHIGNTISVLKDKINYLEDKVITMFKSILAGDVQSLAYELYPEDFEDIEDTETVEGTQLLEKLIQQ